MKKVRVIKEMPFVKVGQCFDVTNNNFLASSDYNAEYLPVLYEGKNVDCFIKAGWLEEVEEPESLLCKLMSTKTFLKTESAQELAHIAMTHAVEVAIKANKTWNGNDGTDIGEYIINALKKESEGI